MPDALQADFFGGGTLAPPTRRIYAPGEEPNPRNPGGISDNELKRRRKADEIKRRAKEQQEALKASRKEQGRKILAARAAEYKRRGGFWGIAVRDAKVLGPVALKAAGTAAAVVATGGAAAGAIGAVSAAGVVAGATTASRVIDAVDTGVRAAGALKKGDVKGLAATAASKGTDMINVKTNIKVPKVPGVKAAVKTAANVKKVVSASKAKVKAPAPVKKVVAKAKATGLGTASAAAKSAAGRLMAAASAATGQRPTHSKDGRPILTAAQALGKQSMPSTKPATSLVKRPLGNFAMKPASGAPRPSSSLAPRPASTSAPAAPAAATKRAALLPKSAGIFIQTEGKNKAVVTFIPAA